VSVRAGASCFTPVREATERWCGRAMGALPVMVGHVHMRRGRLLTRPGGISGDFVRAEAVFGARGVSGAARFVTSGSKRVVLPGRLRSGRGE